MIKLTDNIIELNRDMEPFVIQAGATRTRFFKSKFDDKFAPLQFVHFSDIHAVIDLWNRIAEYINYYSDYISFGIHTGDYCGNNQQLYADLYSYGALCKRPIYNCVGNHDTIITRKHLPVEKKSMFEKLFAPMPDITQDVNFIECDFPTAYYKDIPESNIRIIVLDLYYDVEYQKKWFEKVLDDARLKDFSVITAMHEPTGHIVDSFGVTFHSANDYTGLYGELEIMPFEGSIADFIKKGGEHICNLSGHCHHDLFGVTKTGVLNTTVPCATNWDGWSDGKRVKGTRTYDCFNVVSVDVNLGLLKLCRIGANCDHYLREKKFLCFDYRNKRVISN